MEVPDSYATAVMEGTRFLNTEAELLDDHRLTDWFDLISEDIDYRIPLRTTRERQAATDFSAEAFHMREDYTSLGARIDRLETEYDWSEDPPSRTRRVVSNVRVADRSGDDLSLKSNLVLYRAKGDTASQDILTGERHDTIEPTEDGWKLRRRTVLIDQTVLNLQNAQSLSVFL